MFRNCKTEAYAWTEYNSSDSIDITLVASSSFEAGQTVKNKNEAIHRTELISSISTKNERKTKKKDLENAKETENEPYF